MAFLTVNGVTVPVANSKALSVTTTEVGVGRTRAFDGTARRSNLGFKYDIQGTSTPQILSDANALENLINCNGDHWDFGTDLYSDKGTAATIAGASVLSTTLGKYNGKITLGSGGTANFSGQTLAGLWAIGFWYYATSTWNAYLQFGSATSITATYLNGSAGSSPGILTISGSIATFTGGAAANAISDVFVLPFAPSITITQTAWAAGIYALQNTQAWPSALNVLAAGDFGSYLCEGLITKDYLSLGSMGGTFYDNLKSYDFDLMSV